MANVLKVDSLSFSYVKRQVLDNISFELPSGSVTVVLGANGAGKSTLIKLLSGVYKTKIGKIVIADKDVSGLKQIDYAKLVSYVPQEPKFESSTVIDAVLLGRLPFFTAPKKQDLEKVFEVLEKLDLSDFAMRDVTKLSGGEKQKVAVARSFASSADIIILDEPTSGLDLKNKYSIIKIIKDLSKEGKTILVSMHDVNEALDIGDNYILLNKGSLVATGDKSVLTEDSLSQVYDLEFHKVEHDGKTHFHIKEK